ncbi:GFA family protein [Altererythrobacter sp.]|uniref:GFA family protein n=1 Tax=Altererythrobacter sp. TaxID=1872480 RepID=UPI003D04C98A
MILGGGCHCGAVRFRAEIDPDREVLDCNCSICSQTGYLHVFIPHRALTLEEGHDALTSYRFGSGQAEHLFCSKCGVKSFYQPRSHPDCWSVNFHCLDDGHGWIPDIVAFDGRNWEKSASCLK